MAQSTNLLLYRDVQAVLDAILTAGGGTYELADRKAAIRWRFRAYFYRALVRKAKRKELDLPDDAFDPSTPYDNIVIDKPTDGQLTLRIVTDPITGKLKDLEGRVMKVKPLEVVSDSEIEEAAREFAERLDRGEVE